MHDIALATVAAVAPAVTEQLQQTLADLTRQEAAQGALVVAPAFVRHGWENTGTETLKLDGFLGANVLISEFDEPVAPFGKASFVTPAGLE